MRFSQFVLTNAKLKNWLNISGFILCLPLFLLGYLIPKDRNLWVFGNRYGFKDNPKYLFDYVRLNHSNINAVWISSNPSESSPVDKIFYTYSPAAIYLQYRAKVKILCTGSGDLAKFTCANSNIAQLWHGSPLKKILLDSHSEKLSVTKSLLNITYQRILKKSLEKYDFVIAPSEPIQARLMSAFAKAKTQVPITGYPRVDFIVEQAKKVNELHHQLKLRPKKIILYAPTWRNNPKRFNDHVKLLLSLDFNNFLRSHDFLLICSFHPLSHFQFDSDSLENIIINTTYDINYLASQADVLITDYSSIFYDFTVLKRPIIFFAMDIEIYTKNRGLYDDYRLLTKDRIAFTQQDLIDLILNCDNLELLDGNFYNDHFDSGSCQRIYNKIIGLGKINSIDN